jgi:triacylglycerol lipase
MSKEFITKGFFYSEMARLDKESLSKVLPKAVFIENKKTDTQCYVLVLNSNTLLIAFRGTQQMKDWLTDINAFHVDCDMTVPYGNKKSRIMVHKGFIKAYKSVRDEIHKHVRKMSAKKDFKIIVCGHSLGGALATNCAVDMQYNYTNNVEAYVSGNPRVGNKAFVKSYNERVPNTYRTFMRTDIVPNLPPKKFQRRYGGYAHTKTSNAIGPRNPFIGLINLFSRKNNKESVAAFFANHSIYLYRKYQVKKFDWKFWKKK